MKVRYTGKHSDIIPIKSDPIAEVMLDYIECTLDNPKLRNIDNEKISNILKEIIYYEYLKMNSVDKYLNDLLDNLENHTSARDDINLETRKTIYNLNKLLNVDDDSINKNAIKDDIDFDPPTREDIPEFWLNRNRHKRETPPEFIQRVYSEWLGKGLLQTHVRALDKGLYMAFYKWLQHNEFPTWLILPKKNMSRKGVEISHGDIEIYKKVAAYIGRQKRKKESNGD